MNSKSKIVLFLSIFIFVACSWENESGQNAYDLLYLERNGAQMPIHIHGNIESNIFLFVLHGGPGGNGLQYRPGVFQESLESQYAVVYIDQRGQGMAQGHLNVDQVTIDEMVEDINALTAVIKHKYGKNNSLFLLGHSWGGTLGTAFLATADYQENFNGWIEVSGAHDFNLMVKAQGRLANRIGRSEIDLDREKSFWEEFISTFDEVDTFNISNENIVELNGLAFSAEEKLLNAEIIRDGTEDFLNLPSIGKSLLFSVNPLSSYITGTFTNLTLTLDHDLFQEDIENNLSKIHIPTLLLWGEYDFVVPAELGYQAMERIQSDDIKLVIFEASGHSPMVNEGQKFSDEIIDFIEKYK